VSVLHCLCPFCVWSQAVVGVVRNLRVNAVRMAAAVCAADVKAVGEALGTYWAQKKSLATGAEPREVRRGQAVRAALSCVCVCVCVSVGVRERGRA
jgi:hypothetical protein